MPGFGQVDYTALDRLRGQIGSLTAQTIQQGQQALAIYKERADRENAQAATEQFFRDIQPTAETTPGGTAKVTEKAAGSAPTTSTMSEPSKTSMKPRSAFDVLSAAAKAGAALQRTGGKHSEMAAKNINDYLNARVKLEPEPKAPIKYETTETDEKGNPKVFSLNGVQYLKSNIFIGDKNVGSKFEPHSEPQKNEMAGIAPTKTVGALTEITPNGTLRIKRQANGKPIPLTRAEVTALQGSTVDNQRAAQSQLDALSKQLEADKANQDLMESGLKESPTDNQYKLAVQNAKSQVGATQRAIDQVNKEYLKHTSLLEDLQTYDPNVVTPTPKKGGGSKALIQKAK